MDKEIVLHRIENGRYRIVWEQAASTKGVLGFKCEVNGDDLDEVKIQAEYMLEWAKLRAPAKDLS